MHKKHVKRHGLGQTHQRCLLSVRNAKSEGSPDTRDLSPNPVLDPPYFDNEWHDIGVDEPEEFQSTFTASREEGEPHVAPMSDIPLAFGDLWNPSAVNHTFQFGVEGINIYAEGMKKLDSREQRFSLTPLTEELGVEFGEDSDFGIEIHANRSCKHNHICVQIG